MRGSRPQKHQLFGFPDAQKAQKTKTILDLLDSEGKFESDDEIGTVFEGIKDAVNDLNQLTEKEI